MRSAANRLGGVFSTILVLLFAVQSSVHTGPFPKTRELFGPDFAISIPEVQELNDKAEDSLVDGYFASALKVLERAVEITNASQPGHERDLAIVTASLASAYLLNGDLAEAARISENSLQYGTTKLGAQHPVTVIARNSLGLVRMSAGKLPEAERAFQESISIAENAYGKEHPLVGNSLLWLGLCRMNQGNLAEAVELLNRSASIAEKRYGPDHPTLATVLNSLAEVRLEQGHFKEAEKLARRGIAIREKAFGLDHPAVAESLGTLAPILMKEGDYESAVTLAKRSISILERAGFSENPLITPSLDLLAKVYDEQDDYVKASVVSERSAGIKLKRLPQNHPLVRFTLQHLADCYERAGENQKAIETLEQCLSLEIASFGSAHPAVALSLEKIGNVLMRKREFTKALELYMKALAIEQNAYGKEHPSVASTLLSLGILSDQLGLYDVCTGFFQQSLAIADKIYGIEHPNPVATRWMIGLSFARQSKWREASEIDYDALKSGRNYLIGRLGNSSSHDALRFIARKYEDVNQFQWVCDHLAGEQPSLATQLGATQLFLSKALLEEVEAVQAALEADPRTTTGVLRVQYRAAQEKLALLSTQNANQADAPSDRQKVELELRQLETRIADEIRLVGQTIHERNTSLTDIARNLPTGSVLVDFVKYWPPDFGLKTNAARQAYYVAYLTFAFPIDSTDNHIERVKLGEAGAIDAAVQTIGTRLTAGQYRTRDLSSAMQRLSELVYLPLATYLTNASHLIVCPDSQLSRIPFELLLAPPFTDKPRYLIEDKMVTYVTSGREIVRLVGHSPIPNTNAAVALGNPDFRSLIHKAESFDVPVRDVGAIAKTPAKQRMLSREYRGLSFEPLPETENEARTVAKLLGKNSLLFVGTDAREAVLKQVSSPRVLHLATHGFFLADQQSKAANRTNNILLTSFSAAINSTALRPGNFPREEDLENPIIRCGIALAGANNAATGAGGGVIEDGLLTGLEASMLKLQGTELVILSACQTGVGDVNIGEGVMSLRRAFRIAGAQTVLASHWPVNDKATSLLMTDFIRRWNSGEPKGRAWREAQLTLLRSKDFSHPYFWAAFTLTGDWK